MFNFEDSLIIIYLFSQINLDGTVYKIDWHDWEKIVEDTNKIGPGEQGKPIILGHSEQSRSQASYDSNGFSGYVSDKIALDRSVKDIRNPL